MGTVTKSIGSGGGRDYSTLQAWEDALPANLVTDGNAQVGECYNDSEFTAKLSISGQTTNSTNNITLKAASGQSFYDHANKLTNRLAYNQSNGVAIRTTASYDGTVILVDTNNVTLRGLQVKSTGVGTFTISHNGGPTGFVIDKCIVSGVSRSNLNSFVVGIYGSTSNRITNSLVILDSNAANSLLQLGLGAKAINCTLVRPSNRTAGGRVATAPYATSTIRNCAIFGFTSAPSGTFDSDGHNVTDYTSAPGSTGNVTSATYANQFVQSSTGSSVEDFRIVGTGADLDDAGVTDTTNIPAGDDIVGQTRSTWDVGCWEYVSATTTHTTTGDVAGGGATVAGTATHKTLHTTSGTVAGAGAAVAGAATHPHTTSGVVTGGGAAVAGASDHTTPGGTHATTGDVAGGGASVAGTATHLTLHATSGAVQGGGAAVTGDSAHLTLHTTTGDASGGGATVAGAASRSGINEARSGVVREWLIQFYEQEWAKPVQAAKAPEPPKKVGALKPAVRAVRNALEPVVEAEKVQKVAPRAVAPRKSVARAAQPAVTTIVQTILLQAQKAALQDREFVNALNTRQQQQRAAEAEEAEDEELLLLAVL